jgi:antitoxin HigA-1
MADKTLRHKDLEPGHPGDLLAEIVIPATGKTKAEISKRLGISRQTLHDLLARRQSVTPAVAVRLGKLFGNGPEIWLRMQQAYDLWHAERELEAELSKIETLRTV